MVTIQVSQKTSLSFRLVLLAFLTIAPLDTLTAEECETLRTAGAQQWYPYAFTDYAPHPKATGIAFDVLGILAADLNLALEIQTDLPWKRIEALLDTGELDMLAGNYWTSTRSKKWSITAPFASEDVYLVLSEHLYQEKGNHVDIQELATFVGVMPRGISLGEKFDAIREQIHLIEVKDHDTMYDMMRRKRADYAVSPQHVAIYHLQQKINSGMKLGQAPISSNKVHFAFSNKSSCAKLFPAFNAALNTRLKDGSISKIISRYKLTK